MTLSAQTALLESIERFSQDVIETPADERTPGLVTSRLELLKSYWANLAYNHVTLLPLEEAQDSDYIQGNNLPGVKGPTSHVGVDSTINKTISKNRQFPVLRRRRRQENVVQ